MPPIFPINDVLREILASLTAHPRLVLEAPPGAGKTTQVPLALLKSTWCTRKIIMLEPRRIAARAAAGFMATQLSETVGQTIGYRIRFERKVSNDTRLEIVTEGILTRLIQDDPTLSEVDAVIFDEFHERHIASDLGLALCLDIQASLRPDLRILVMSATLDGERVAHFLDAPRVTSAGRSFHVDIQYFPARTNENIEHHIKRTAQLALSETDGDILCFLPGKAEIDRCTRVLTDVDAETLSLHGEMNLDEQSRALSPSYSRRIVLATNVAESSLTLPGVRAVIDSGLAREPRFDPNSGMSRLETVYIAQSSATQRAGRAGRIAPGRCYRLWPESQRLDSSTRPEMHRVDLCTLVLELKAWGNEAVHFLDPPPPGNLAQAHDILRALDALDESGTLTAHGRALLDFGTHPRLANAMLRAPDKLKGLACDVAALLEGRDPLRGIAARNNDLRTRVIALEAFRARRSQPDISIGAMRQIEETSRHYRRRLNFSTVHNSEVDSHGVGDVLAFAYPDRIAKRSDKNPRRYQLSNGRGARLHDDSTLAGEPWLVVAEIKLDEGDSLIQKAAAFDPDLLERAFGGHFKRERGYRVNSNSWSVEIVEIEKFAALTLIERVSPANRSPTTAKMLLDTVAERGLEILPFDDRTRELQLRVECLRQWCPDLKLSDLSDDALLRTLSEWLEPILSNKTRLSEIRADELHDALHGLLDYSQHRVIDQHAPAELLVPSGMRRGLSYKRGEPPALAVKIQELFGLADTPRIAQGRVPVVLHLLSPRQIPIQVTQDLRGFWDRTYPEVKKELKGRYPKHPWPDDPWTAVATHRAKPRN